MSRNAGMPRDPDAVLLSRLERLEPGCFIQTCIPFHRLFRALEVLRGKGIQAEIHPCTKGYMIRRPPAIRGASTR